MEDLVQPTKSGGPGAALSLVKQLLAIGIKQEIFRPMMPFSLPFFSKILYIGMRKYCTEVKN
ncbi:hypothetical protein [Mesorhizobium sp. M1365]|uniref:hypothetical protein n=1 Tax=Mesorhizobium sp. M1365 TaxID=2957090 RepID=UPI003334D9AD